MNMFWLFLHALVFCFLVFLSFAAPHLAGKLALAYLYGWMLFPKRLSSGGRDWIASSTTAIVLPFMLVLWLSGQRQLATWLHYTFCLTVYLQAELHL